MCDALWAQGQRTLVARLTSTEYIYPPFWMVQAASIAAALPEEDDVVLAAHSGAGVLLPAIGRFSRNRSCEASVVGYLFVDCDLPRDGHSRLDLFDDSDAAAALRTRSNDGWIPKWTEEQMAPLITDAAIRQRFLDSLPRTPLELYEELIGVPNDWPDAPCGYLQLSGHYPGAISEAREKGWAMRHLESNHFAPLDDPDRVAQALIDLLGETVSGQH